MEFIHASTAKKSTQQNQRLSSSSNRLHIKRLIDQAIEDKYYSVHISGTIDSSIKEELEDLNYNVNYNVNYTEASNYDLPFTTISWK